MIHKLRFSKEIKGMQANHWEAQNQRILLEFNFNDEARFHLNSWVRESMRGRVHKPSRWRRSELVLVSQTWGSTAQYELWFILAFCILVRSVLCTCCGSSQVYMHESSERSPPHLFLYLVLIQKQKHENKLIALLVLRTRELLKFIETKI